MAYFERMRDQISGAFSPDIVKQRTSAGWQMVSQNSDKGFKILPGDQAQFTLVTKNTGNVTWTNSGATPTRLATWYPTNPSSPFCSGWASGSATWASSPRKSCCS